MKKPTHVLLDSLSLSLCCPLNHSTSQPLKNRAVTLANHFAPVKFLYNVGKCLGDYRVQKKISAFAIPTVHVVCNTIKRQTDYLH